jgi:hypothetical protein
MTGARYHKVYTRLWSSPEFRVASDDQRLATVYVLTCRHRTTEGLFVLPLPLAAHELGWPIDRTRAAFELLERTHFVAVDSDTDVIWLVNAVAWNKPKGPKQLQGAVNTLAEVPDTFLRPHYLLKCRADCPDLAAAIESQLGWPDTLSDTLSDTPSIPLRYPFDSSSSSSSSSSNSSSSVSAPSDPGDPIDTPPPLAEVVELADRIVETLGIVDALANEGERRIVARALERGWTRTELIDAGWTVAARDDIDRPRAYLLKVLTRMANDGPDEGPAKAERRPTLDDERPDCTACAGSGWVDVWDHDQSAGVEPCPTCARTRLAS